MLILVCPSAWVGMFRGNPARIGGGKACVTKFKPALAIGEAESMTNLPSVCALCGEAKPLMESHIFPRFVFAWMRRTGSQFLRQSGSPNTRRQDGPKDRLLCFECEQLFSRREKWFSEQVFIPYLDHSSRAMAYDESLYYFLVSVLWRVLKRDLSEGDGNHWYQQPVLHAEAEWREYLLHGVAPTTFADIHVFLTDIGSPNKPQPIVNFNRYMARAVDGTIASSSNTCFVYAKFSRFLVFGAITPFDQTLFVNTKVNQSGGTLAIPQELLDGRIGEFLLDRARTQYQMTVTGMSDRQKQIIAEALGKELPRILNSDLGRSILADYGSEIDPLLLWPAVGHQEACPCGSGQSFGVCHGAAT